MTYPKLYTRKLRAATLKEQNVDVGVKSKCNHENENNRFTMSSFSNDDTVTITIVW